MTMPETPELAMPLDEATSERRLHPMSWLFVLIQQLRQFIIPIIILFAYGRGDRNDLWGLVAICVLAAISIWQYYTYRFSIASDKPVITQGAFDSENLAFWDPLRKEYRAYWRIFTAGVTDDKKWKPAGFRAIRTATSKDALSWSEPADVRYVDSPVEHLYTNQVLPYYRAPHIFMGFPMRYTDRGWSESMRALPGLEERLARAKANQRYGTAVTDGLFMTSRDGVLFHRWNEAFLRPGPRQKGTWVYGDNMTFWGMVETASALGDAPNELSIFATEDYWQGVGVSFRRLTLRLDGFVSLWAPARGGELLTKPLVFDGGNLTLNLSTAAAGSLQVEIQDAAGQAIPWPTARKSSATIWPWWPAGKTAATCDRSRAKPSACASSSRMPTCTPSSSCPYQASRSAPRVKPNTIQ